MSALMAAVRTSWVDLSVYVNGATSRVHSELHVLVLNSLSEREKFNLMSSIATLLLQCETSQLLLIMYK